MNCAQDSSLWKTVVGWGAALVLCLVSVEASAFEVDVHRKLRGPFAIVELHESVFSDASSASITAGSFGYGGRIGYRWAGPGAYLIAEHNMWVSTNAVGKRVTLGAVNFGLGLEYAYLGGFLTTSAAVGPSVLAFDTVLDSAGTTGLFVHVRPIGVRIPVTSRTVVALDPLCFAMVAPVLTGIPLVYTEYRTIAGLEVAL